MAAQLPAGGLSFRVEEVYLISRRGFASPFAFQWAVPLGGGAAPRRVGAPYVATVARPPSAALAASEG